MISSKDIKNISISPVCYETYPCQHDVTIITNNETYTKCVSSTNFNVLLKHLGKKKYHTEESEYKPNLENNILNIGLLISLD